ncbi:MAG: TonB-dependent receptor [Sphingomonadales bacterium]|nr:TonB-dependent receptor [Sphingomonadales bacterium]
MKSNNIRRATVLILGSTALLAIATSAHAQTPPVSEAAQAGSEPMGDQIIVTARRRDETLLQVPVAISAVSAADINRYAATDLSKIGQLIPQVILAKTGGGGAGASFSIRGIGSSALDAGIDQTVSLNIDGLQISRGRLITQGFFDIAQVEVLKGPQALFFGKNSPGGVISVHTNGPTKELSGYLRGGYEFNARQRYVEGAIAGPITDTLGFRIAIRGDKMAGYIKNTAQPLLINNDPATSPVGAAHGRDPGTREILGRATLVWTPSSSFDATLKVFGDKARDNGETAGTEVKCASAHPSTLDLLSGTYITDPSGDCKLNGERSLGALNPSIGKNYPNSNNGVPYTKYNSFITSLTMNYKLDDVTFTSVTGYWHYNNKGFDSFSYDASALVTGYNADSSHAFTQELRFNTKFSGPLNFAGGLYYEKSGRDTQGDGGIAIVGQDPRNGQTNNWTLLTTNSGQAYSGFGQAIYNIRSNIELAAGVRFTRETKKVSLGNSFVNQNFVPFGIVSPEGVFTSGKFADNNWSPEATLTWHPTDRTTLYAAYKTGYKSGGFSNPSILSTGQGAQNLGFDPEHTRGGEIGAKGSFFGGKLTINSAIYQYKYKGLQLTSFNPVPPSFTIKNAASARTTGAEIDASYTLTRAIQVRLSGGYNKAKYLAFPAAACYAGQTAATGCTGANATQDLSGTSLVRAPKLSLTGGVSYDAPVTDSFNLGLSTDANYTSGYWLLENQNPAGYQKGFARLNASIRIHKEDDSWELAFIGRNLTNKFYAIAGNEKPFGTPDQIEVSIGRPRELLLQGTVRF